MGGACCVAARDKNIVSGPGTDILQRNIRYSPTWSFRWDNRGRVAGEDASIDWFSDGVTRSCGSDTKYELAYTSEDGSPQESFQRQTWKKSPTLEETGSGARTLASDQSMSRNISKDTSLEQAEVKESRDVLTVSSPSPMKLSLTLPSTSSYATSQLLSHNHLHPTGSTTPRWVHKSPGHQLTEHESDARYPELKSSTSFRVTEERSTIPARANKSTRGSQGRSSDGWSMHAFSELVATSQRESWSPDNERLGFSYEKTRSNDEISSNPIDLQTCGICSKLLTEKSLWSSHKLFVTNELGVVSVLTCGHVYHGDCLETMTSETDKYDPACPICTLGEKQTLKLSQKAFKAQMDLKARSKRSKNRVVDRDLYGDSIMFDYVKANGQEGKGPKMASSSSMKSSLAKPLSWRHFSFGSKSNRSSTDIHTTRKKGSFWSRSMKA